jgi:signal transduction histidine kinase
MASERGLTRRLGRELLLQAVYISIAVAVGVYAVAQLMEGVLIEQALEGEAAYYWERASVDPGAVLPDTLNLTAYRDGLGAGVPDHLAGLPDGFHRRTQPRETLAYVTTRNGDRLYLEFEAGQVRDLVTTFGVVPLALALTVIYLSLFSAYRVSRRAVSPLVDLARRVQQLDPSSPSAELFGRESRFNADEEIQILSQALEELVTRVVDFAERERRFTRDASHELRTPLTVISMAVDKLLRQEGLDDDNRKTLLRIRNSARDMEQLTAAFLLLARESNKELPQELVSVNELVRSELERARLIDPDSRTEVTMEEQCQLMVRAPAQVLESVIGNLFRNACNYTDEGRVTVRVQAGSVVVEDTGPGMAADEVEKMFQPFYRGQRRRGGFGVGLTIVKRLTERFGWPLHVDSEPGRGTSVRVGFPEAEIS